MTLTWIFLLVCGWLAGTLSGVTGFGGALLLMPVLAHAKGGKAAVMILTVAQIIGNASRAGFGWHDIRWRPAFLFSFGAVPGCIFGARYFVKLSSTAITRWIGILLVLIAVLRHTRLGKRKVSDALLPPAGTAVGFLSAIAGSAGPLGATVFLSLNLPPQAYVSSEAVTAVLIHLTKTATYGRYAAMTASDFVQGLALGGSLLAGSWTGRTLIAHMPARGFSALIEMAIVASAVALILQG